MADKVAVSVIVPVYNTKGFLPPCLDGLLSQTMRDFEIICVNDGSTDGSAELLRSYAARDCRIRILSEENSGLSCARNRGFSAARGRYIYFHDSDDFLEPDALEAMCDRAEADRLDVLYFDAESFYESPELEAAYPAFRNMYHRKGTYPAVCDGQTMYERMEKNREYRVPVWLQFFRREFLLEKEISFYPGVLHEDNAFCFDAMLEAERVGYLPSALYHRRIRRDSIMTRPMSFENVYGYFYAFLAIYASFSRLKGNLRPEVRVLAAKRLCRVLQSAQDCYLKLSPPESDETFDPVEDFVLFKKLVKEPTELRKPKEDFKR